MNEKVDFRRAWKAALRELDAANREISRQRQIETMLRERIAELEAKNDRLRDVQINLHL